MTKGCKVFPHMNDPKNVELLSEMQANGHEISYHYDVMDSNKGDIDKAMEEFEQNAETFRHNGFDEGSVFKKLMSRYYYLAKKI